MLAWLVDMFNAIAALFGSIIAIGGSAAAIAYGIFKISGEKWINNKFEQRLSAYKHAQQEEMERLKFKINALMDRTVKLHQRGFDVLPECWSRLADAQDSILSFISSIQIYPNLNLMNGDQLKEFLDGSELHKWQIDELWSEEDKTRYYMKAIYWHRKNHCRSSLHEFSSYVRKNGIFLPEDLRKSFGSYADLLWQALIEHETNEEEEVRPRMRERKARLESEGAAIVQQIEADVHSRLWSQHVGKV